jgi:hypothetical protein
LRASKGVDLTDPLFFVIGHGLEARRQGAETADRRLCVDRAHAKAAYVREVYGYTAVAEF